MQPATSCCSLMMWPRHRPWSRLLHRLPHQSGPSVSWRLRESSSPHCLLTTIISKYLIGTRSTIVLPTPYTWIAFFHIQTTCHPILQKFLLWIIVLTAQHTDEVTHWDQTPVQLSHLSQSPAPSQSLISIVIFRVIRIFCLYYSIKSHLNFPQNKIKNPVRYLLFPYKYPYKLCECIM